jgi:hypothetical protein
LIIDSTFDFTLIAEIICNKLYSKTGCEPNEFKCVSSDRCIASEFRCDGISDCDDESDEIRCGKYNYSCMTMLELWLWIY